MKIGIEAQRIFRTKKHGMDIVALELIRNLQQIDSKNQYFVFVKDDEDNKVLNETKNFKIVKIPHAPYPYWEQALLPRAVREHGIELIHCTSNTAPLNIGVPLVVTLHDIIYLEQWNFTKGTSYQILGNLYRRWNVPPVVRRCDKIITVSQYEQRRIERHFGLGPGKVETVYNGVSSHFMRITDERLLSEVRVKYNLPADYIFFLGNTDPKKNVAGVLKALAILLKSGPLPYKLVMPDIDRAFLEGLAMETGNKDILSYIHFTGYVPNSELPGIYSMASLFLYPSLRESFGIPILEAMACEVPVITSVSSSMPEVAGDSAILIDPTSPEAIAKAIRDLMASPVKRSELIQKGRIRSGQFSWRKNAEQTLKIYESVLSSKGLPLSGRQT